MESEQFQTHVVDKWSDQKEEKHLVSIVMVCLFTYIILVVSMFSPATRAMVSNNDFHTFSLWFLCLFNPATGAKVCINFYMFRRWRRKERERLR